MAKRQSKQGVCVIMHVLHCVLLPMVVFWMTNHYVVGSKDKEVHDIIGTAQNPRQRRAWSALQRNWGKIMIHAHMRNMIEVAEEHKRRKRQTVLIKDIYQAPTDDQADRSIALIPQKTDSEDEGTGGDGGGGVPVGVVSSTQTDGQVSLKLKIKGVTTKGKRMRTTATGMVN